MTTMIKKSLICWLAVLLLVCLSIPSHVSATAPLDGQKIVQPKSAVSFSEGQVPTPQDFVSLSEQEIIEKIQFKDDVPNTATAGMHTATLVVDYQDGNKETITVPYKVAAIQMTNVTAKQDLHFKQGEKTPAASAFITAEDPSKVKSAAFKSGAVPDFTTAGQKTAAITVTFADDTSTELQVSYMVTAVPLAHPKTALRFPIGKKLATSDLLTAESGVALSVIKGQLSTSKVGTFSTTIEAKKGDRTETFAVSYQVIDTEKPLIKPKKEQLFVFDKGATIKPQDLVTATDNSGKVSLTFKKGWVPKPDQLGDQLVRVVATDPAGNFSDIEIAIMIWNDVPTLKTPKLDFSKTTDLKLVGTADPHTLVFILDEYSELIGSTYADKNGHFALELETALPEGMIISLTATDETGNYSGMSTYFYDEEKEDYTDHEDGGPDGDDLQVIITSQRESGLDNQNNTLVLRSARVKKLPKTGDSFPAASAAGLLILSAAYLLLRKPNMR